MAPENRTKYILDVFGSDPAKAPRVIVDRPMTQDDLKPVMVKVRDFDHLKELIGVPNRVHESNKTIGPESMPYPIHPGTLPLNEKMKVRALSQSERARAKDMAKNLLLGYASTEMLRDPAIAAVAEHMLELGAVIPVATVSDVVVKTGETLTLQDTVLNAGTITVYGTGQIKTVGTVKIVANQFIYQP